MSETKPISPVSPALRHQFEELQERASKDSLSGLLNRATAEIYIKQRLSQIQPGELCALFIIDLDNFKQVNDTLGHLAGDQAIQQTAQILSGLFRATDIVGRLGGDEFIVFISGFLTETLIQRKGREICEHLQMFLGSHPVLSLTASVGIHISSKPGHHFDDLYQSADLALYQAKRNGKHGFVIRHGEDFPASDNTSFFPVNTIPLTGILEHLDNGVALVELSDSPNLIYVSPSFCRILGIEPQECILPLPLPQLIHPDDLADLEETLRNSLEHNATAEHTHRISPDGEKWFWWHIHATPINYDHPHPVMLVTTTDISQFKKSEQHLLETNKRLQSAFEQTSQGMWEVDLNTKNITVFNFVNSSHPSKPVQGKFPDFLISNGWIHPRSTTQFQEFAAELLKGKAQGYGNFVLQYQETGCYGWAALSYRQLYDELGRAVKAVGIVEKLPQEFVHQDSNSLIKRFFPNSMLPYLIVGLKANLTQDTVSELWSEGRNCSGQASEKSCTQVLQEELYNLFSLNDRQTLDKYFDRACLIDLYEKGERWLTLEYRRIDGCGNIRWVSHVINLVQDPLSQDIYLFSYLIQSQLKRQREMDLEIRVIRDSVTSLYDRATTRAMIEFQLGKGYAGECATAIIQLYGLDKMYAENQQDLDRQRCHLAAALTVALGPLCIIGQYDRDKILVFFPEIHSQESVKQLIEEAFSFVRLALAGSSNLDSLRLIAGAVCSKSNRASYVSMSSQAIQLCQLWQNAVSDTVAFSPGNEDWSWNELQHTVSDDQITVGRNNLERPLSQQEKDVAFQCLSSMLTSDSLDTSIRSVLSYIGTYYQADRVYVLTLAENHHVITMPYEWTCADKPSIQQAVSGLLIDRFPILRRCLDEKAPVFLSRTHAISESPAAQTDKHWSFTTFPLIESDTIVGFLCIENAREHPKDAALFTTLIPYILKEQHRFHSQTHMSGETSAISLSQLPNLRSYMNVIYSLNSDVYSSMGAVCLDIPGLSSINSNQGFEYGSKLLWYVSKTLSDIFGHSFIFRTWDAEFVALCPDTTRQVFIGRCTRLRSTLQRRYPKSLRIGYIWSSGVFSGKALVNEARSIMRCERVDVKPHSQFPVLWDGLTSIKEAVSMGRFVVYLQPKVHMDTGNVLGAEALVRGLDEDGNLIYPDRFIKELEKSGDIRDLDLYVLEQTLALMERWRKKQYRMIPVSVNFSRTTLFDPSIFASVLAIQSRYPLLPPGSLEIEITEGGENVENQSLSEVINRFREFGIRFALDDFGSKYANISIFTNVKFDCVKLDRSLITELPDSPRGQMLIHDLVKICHNCGMLCVAEGVENQTQISMLTEMGCTCGQGYYFDRPLPAMRFEEKYLCPV